ncbi:HAMP domain-containing sensor histidine kinase [Clostridium sp. HBUAS56010]|uniref:sensor histidine kinase n=1 Tax=Clostridium sp. HBUAS56010 TaxID=2571127 RepID=UPI0011778790|nr:HAMP domain-containing sensor histidine kinase [Clostridium sp. HBUAS56010]
MDIKSRNRHRISLFLAVIVVLCVSAVMVGLYPFFKNESFRNKEPVYQERGFLKYLTYGNYVLAMEQARAQKGEILSPFQLFFPNAADELKNQWNTQNQPDTENQTEQTTVTEYFSEGMGYEEESDTRQRYLQELRHNCVREFDNWNRNFGRIRNFMDYQVLDGEGTVLTDHSDGRSISSDKEYQFKAVLHYDGQGRMEVISTEGGDTASLLSLLQDFGDEDPMEQHYADEYKYDSQLKMDNPQNMTFTYGMTQQQIDAFQETAGDMFHSYDNSGSVLKLFLGFVCAVAVIAFFFSCFDVTWQGSSRILRTPFEVVFSIGSGGVAFGAGLTSLVEVTNQGELFAALIRANFLPGVADIMVKLWNVFWWSIPFGVVYWSVLCLRDVITIGLKRYLRERTLCGWFWGWIKRVCVKTYKYVGNINLKEQPDRTIFRIVGVNFIILALLCSMWFLGIGALVLYSIILFFVMRKYYKDLREKYQILLNATNQIAEGNLEVVIEEDLSVFEPFKKEMQKIQSGFKVAVEEEVKSQKLKTDLISNMSHDLKTPLTAIITYVNLMKDERVTPEQRKAYIDILEQKSMRLKSLIEDLFEISKANSNNVTLNLEEVDIVSLLKEVSLELSDKIEESSIDFRWNLPEEKIVLPLDGQKTYRIFDNLLTNIIKYAMPNTRAYIDMKKVDGYVVTTLKNVSAAELTFNPEEITERFARGDQSRNTEGSGLGMAIAKSFVELQNGKLQVELEADLFRVIIRWPVN